MFTHNYTKGVVLKSYPRGEADSVYLLYTDRFGKISVIGRSIRKGKLSMGMKLFSLVEIGFIEGRSYNTLTDVVPLCSFPESRKELSKLSLFYRISETVLLLIRGEEKQESVFNLIVNTMSETEKRDLSTKQVSLVHTYFSFRLLDMLGYRPATDRCSVCKREIKEETYFSSEEKGVVCHLCSTPLSISIGDVRSLSCLFEEKMDLALEQDDVLLGRLLEDYLCLGNLLN